MQLVADSLRKMNDRDAILSKKQMALFNEPFGMAKLHTENNILMQIGAKDWKVAI